MDIRAMGHLQVSPESGQPGLFALLFMSKYWAIREVQRTSPPQTEPIRELAALGQWPDHQEKGLAPREAWSWAAHLVDEGQQIRLESPATNLELIWI